MNKRIGLIALATVFVALVVGPGAAMGSQSTKNQWRNLGTGAAALGVYGLATHNSGLAIAGIAGAAYSANRYETDRRHQSQARQRYLHRQMHRRHYSNRTYYWYEGHEYYLDRDSGSRTRIQ